MNRKGVVSMAVGYDIAAESKDPLHNYERRVEKESARTQRKCSDLCLQ
jgi:hypothetical protein